MSRAGACCEAPGALTEDKLCCPHALDRCHACGDGSSCNTEGVLTLQAVPDAALDTIADVVKAAVCTVLGFSDVATCPVVIMVGSAVAPASRQRRLAAIARHGFVGAAARDRASYAHLQACSSL